MSDYKQRTLTFNFGGEDIVSRPFDFEAMCLMNDVHSRGDKGKFSISKNALPYMFEGTKVTNSVLENASVADIAMLCDRLWDIYAEELVSLAEAKSKNAKSPARD